MGKLGGCELNYSSDIDLIFLYDGDGKTDGQRPITNAEFFDQLGPRARPPADRERPSWAAPTASTCGCGPRGSAARWP